MVEGCCLSEPVRTLSIDVTLIAPVPGLRSGLRGTMDFCEGDDKEGILGSAPVIGEAGLVLRGSQFDCCTALPPAPQGLNSVL